jgi:hypothetical protein
MLVPVEAGEEHGHTGEPDDWARVRDIITNESIGYAPGDDEQMGLTAGAVEDIMMKAHQSVGDRQAFLTLGYRDIYAIRVSAENILDKDSSIQEIRGAARHILACLKG